MIRATDVLDEIAEAGGSDISIKRVLRAIVKEFGGPDEFAREVVNDFNAVVPGHASRIRLTTAIITSLGVYGSDDNGEHEDVESVEAELKALLGGGSDGE